MTTEKSGFEVADYVVCGVSLSISISIGIYYALAGGRQKTSQEYHLGNRNFSFIPVMISLMVTTQSSILIIGVPAEVYMYGILSALSGLAISAAYLIGSRIIVPIVHPLKITSVNEYFELRYGSRHVRLFMTFLTVFFWVIYIGIISFGFATAIESGPLVPFLMILNYALVYSHLSSSIAIFLMTVLCKGSFVGIPLWISILSVSGASMLYTTVGGIKAVVWTDVFQFLIMLSGVLAVLFQGSRIAGGGSNVLRLNSDGDRLAIWNFSLDPRTRYTMWNMVIGNTLKFLAFPLQQSTAQRVACMPSINDAYRMFYAVTPIMLLMTMLAMSQGIVAFAYFTVKRCDPLTSGTIRNPNQIIPHMVMEIFEGIPGMTGLFMSGLMCATLSTISSGYAALSSITLHDIIKLRYSKISERKGAIVSKVSVAVYCLITLTLSFLMANVKGSVFKMALVLLAIPMAPYSGVFLYSVFCTSATTAGALTGGTSALLFYIWVSMGQTFSDLPKLNEPLSPAPIDMCYYNHTAAPSSSLYPSTLHNISYLPITSTLTPHETEIMDKTLEGLQNLYSISFQWFDVMAMILAISVGLIVSKLVGAPHEDDVDIKYVLSFWEQFFPWLPQKVKYYLSCRSSVGQKRKKYLNDQKELDIEGPKLLEDSSS